MEQNNIKEFERITRIAHGKIPVSEESSVFSLFSARREVCKSLRKTMVETDRQYYLNYLEKIEDNIRLYLCL